MRLSFIVNLLLLTVGTLAFPLKRDINNEAVDFIRSSTSFIRSFDDTSEHSKNNNKKSSHMKRMKEKFSSLHNQKSFRQIKRIINELIDNSTINELRNGQTIEDFKTTLQFAITAMYSRNMKKRNFDSNRFFDEILSKSDEVIPNGLFETDIILTKEQAQMLFSNDISNDLAQERKKRKVANVDYAQRWSMPIRYFFDGTHNTNEQTTIRNAILGIEAKTCLNFHELTTKNDSFNYIVFNKGQGCSSNIGFLGIPTQYVTLGEGCVYTGTIQHELYHILGLFHEQSRPDRDNYISVLYDNIEYNKEVNFESYPSFVVETYGIPYDLSSIMHYGSKSFSKNNNPTIVTKDLRYQRVIGQRIQMGFSDIKAVNMAYCSRSCNSTVKCEREGYQNPKNCSTCLCPSGFSGDFCEKLDDTTNCGGLLTNSNGSIRTPNYPNPYPSLSKCVWLIQAPKGKLIKLKIHQNFYTTCFDPSNNLSLCDQDWLEVRSNSLHLTGMKYCCGHPPDIIQSDKDEMLVMFVSTIKNTNSIGVLAYYEFVNDNNDMENVSSNKTTTTIKQITTKDQAVTLITTTYATSEQISSTKRFNKMTIIMLITFLLVIFR